MPRRVRALIALVSIALVAVDAVVGVWGHAHADEPVAAVKTHTSHHHGGGCSHHHHVAANEAPQHSSSSEHSDRPSHDDCALCRHFSQPVSPAVIVFEISDCERVESLVLALCPRNGVVAIATHTARGPPTFGA